MSRVQIEGYRQIVKDTRSGAIINTDRSAYQVHIQRIKEAKESQNNLRNAVRDINNLKQEFSVTFATRPKAEIDDIIGFFESTNGVTAFDFTFADTNAGSNEETVKVYVKEFKQNWDYDDYYTCSATLVRVYEA